MPGTAVKSFAGGYDSRNVPEVFAVLADNQVHTARFTAPDTPIGGFDPAPTHPGKVEAVAVGEYALGPELFVIAMSDRAAPAIGQSGLLSETRSLRHAFAGNRLPRMPALGQVKSLAVSSDAFGNPELFVVLQANDEAFAEKFSPGGDLNGSYVLAAAGKVTVLAAAHDAKGNPELFVILEIDSQVYTLPFDPGGDPLPPPPRPRMYRPLPGPTLRVLTLSVGYDVYNEPELFVLDYNHHVHGRHFDKLGLSASAYFGLGKVYVTVLGVTT